MKNELFDRFVRSYGKKEVETMKEAYDTLLEFNGQQRCMDFYVSKVTESLEM